MSCWSRVSMASASLRVMLSLSSVIWVSQLRATQLEGLVTSARSLALRDAGLAEMLRIIREDEAPSLARKLTSMGAAACIGS